MSLLKESVKGWWQANRFHLCCFPEYWALGWAWGTKHLGLYLSLWLCNLSWYSSLFFTKNFSTWQRYTRTYYPATNYHCNKRNTSGRITKLECWCTFHSTLSCFHPANILKHNYFLVSVVLYWWVAQCICGVSHNKGHNLTETDCAVSVSYKWWTGP